MSAASDFERIINFIEEQTDFIESQRVAQMLSHTVNGLMDFPHIDAELRLGLEEI